MRKTTLALLFLTILIVTAAFDIYALLFGDNPFLVAAQLWPRPWIKAASVDSTSAFLFLYLWIAQKEPRILSKVIWLCFIAATGSIAFATYLLLQLWQLGPTEGVDALLVKHST